MPKFTGIVPPLCTPLNDDFSVDTTSLRRHVEIQLDAGVHGVFVLGSSSEVAFLPDAQRRVVVETTVDQVAGRVPVLAGCIDMTAEIDVQSETTGKATTTMTMGADFYPMLKQMAEAGGKDAKPEDGFCKEEGDVLTELFEERNTFPDPARAD